MNNIITKTTFFRNVEDLRGRLHGRHLLRQRMLQLNRSSPVSKYCKTATTRRQTGTSYAGSGIAPSQCAPVATMQDVPLV